MIVIGAIALLTRHDWEPTLQHLTGPGSSASAAASESAATPCPADIADKIPGENSTLISQYQTSEYEVTLCKTSAGAIYYHGAEKDDASVQITLPATQVDGSYKASNHGYTYWVTKKDLKVTMGGRTLLDQSLRPS